MAEDATNKIKSLKQELRESILLTQQLANAPVLNEDALNKSIQRTAELRDRVNDVNERVGVLTGGSQFEILSNNIGDIGGKIASLDFEGANESAQRLVTLTKNIKFADAVKGVKDLGSTFLNLGKALLTNPLFLIAAAIGLAVAAVVKLLDKMGVLKKIGEAVGFVFEKIGEFIEFIADSTAAVVDMVFGTTLVAEKQAQELAAQQDKLLEKVKAKSQAATEASDREIKEQKALGKNTEALEKKKLELIVKTAEVEFKIYQERFRNKTYLAGLDQEEIENQRKLYKESLKGLKDAQSDLKVFNNERIKEKEDANKKEAEVDKGAAEKARVAAKQYAADRLSAQRQIKDLELAALTDGIDKDLAINEEKYRRLIEDTKRNEKLLAKEKETIIKELAKQQVVSEQKIRENANKANIEAQKQADANKIEQQNDLNARFEAIAEENFQASLTEQQRELTAVQDKYFELETLAEGNAEALANIETAKNRELAEINKRYSDEQDAKTKEDLEKRNKEIKDSLNQLAGILNGFASKTGSEFAGAIGNTLGQLSLAFDTFTDENATKLEKFGAAVQAITSIVNGFISAAVASNKEKLEEDIANIDEANTREQESLQAKYDAGLISKEQFEKSSADLDAKAVAEKNKKGKEAFDKNKKLQIASAAIAGLQGAVSAFAGAMSLGPIAGPIVGAVLAAAVAGLTAVNIGKIKSTQFESASAPSGGGSPNVSSSSLGGNQAAQPAFNLFGQGNNANTVGAGSQQQQQNQNMNMTVQSSVSVTEINAVQNKVAVQESRSTL